MIMELFQDYKAKTRGTWKTSWYAGPVILGLLLAPVPYLLAHVLPENPPEHRVVDDPAVIEKPNTTKD